MSLRREFVTLASQPEANVSGLCRRFGISRKTGYKWIGRFEAEGLSGLEDRSRRPHRSPSRTSTRVEAVVCHVRREHPAWSGYKIRQVLLRKARNGSLHIDASEVPAASTCQAILDRHGLVEPSEPQEHSGWTRFEEERPNELWQMDFKGAFPTTEGAQIYPLSVLDDHSRFSLALRACPDQRADTARQQLTRAVRRYGLPDEILVDKGPPWGSPYTARLGTASPHQAHGLAHVAGGEGDAQPPVPPSDARQGRVPGRSSSFPAPQSALQTLSRPATASYGATVPLLCKTGNAR